MNNEKNKFLTVSWLSGLLSAEIFISTGEWGVQMPPLTSDNSHFLRSGPQGATLVMYILFRKVALVISIKLSFSIFHYCQMEFIVIVYIIEREIFSLHILQYQNVPVLATISSSHVNSVQFLWTFLWQQLQWLKYEWLRILLSHIGQVIFMSLMMIW